jgi:hypothetical protein
MPVPKKTVTKPAPKPPVENNPSDVVTNALADALAAIIGVVETMALSGAVQGTSGAQGTVGGTAVEAGKSSQSTQTADAHKNDIGGPEAAESYITAGLNSDSYMNRVNARTFDVTSALVNGMTAGHIANINQQQVNVTTHADEEFSARKRATEMGLITLGDATEEAADDTDRA